ncbi:hypothetical protein RND81_04G042800 [Saponaria officinalis]|uniref:Myb-like domain-containing protein n=1 Tax=Saponaria officinalis TaxID=3572 RepID=A0AAW1LCJ2_SAPOF
MKVVIKGNPWAFLNQGIVREEKWTPSEDQTILNMAKKSSNPWREMSSKLGRSPSACLGRYEELVKENCSERVALKRRTSPKPIEESGFKRSKVVDKIEVCLSSFEQALQHLREEVYATIQPLSQANLSLEQQIKERDECIQNLQKMLDNIQSQLQASKEKKRQASIVELTDKHQKCLESLEMQLGEAMSEQNTAAETISSLRDINTDKDSKQQRQEEQQGS